MKSSVLMTMITFLAGIFFAAGAFAGDMKTYSIDKSVTKAQSTLHSGGEFIGTDVRDVNGNKIGEVEDLRIDFNHGITYAVVENDKLTEIDKRFLVPLSAFKMSHDTGYVSLPLAKEALTNYPKHDRAMDQETYGRNLHQFYGIAYPWDERKLEKK